MRFTPATPSVHMSVNAARKSACATSLTTPFAGLGQFPDLAADQVALEGTDVADVEPAVQMVDLVIEGARQQILAVHFERFAFYVLSPYRHFFRTPHLFPKTRKAEAAFFTGLRSLFVNDLRIDENDLLLRI